MSGRYGADARNVGDKNPAYGEAIRELKRRDQLAPELEHRQVK